MTSQRESPQAPFVEIQNDARPRRRRIGLALCVLALLVLLPLAWPVKAAVELAYFEVLVSPTEVLLEWATEAEYNLAGFEVFCKAEIEPAAAYHPIGSVVAEGSPTSGGFYNFEVTNLDPGIPYCFRITEITTDDSAAESFDRCGFGLNITPTPVPPTPQASGVVAVSPLETPNPDQNPIPAGVVELSTSVPTVPAAAEQIPGNPTPTPLVVSPLDQPTPLPVAESPLDAAALQATAQAEADALQDELDDEGGDEGEDGQTLVLPDADLGATASNSLLVQQTMPNPLYVVVTATATSEAVDNRAFAPPTFTPLPTVTPESDATLFALTEITSENLLLATLCVVFFGASGIGVLGITSLGLYFRSRSDRERRL